jgi:hypothetical protein
VRVHLNTIMRYLHDNQPEKLTRKVGETVHWDRKHNFGHKNQEWLQPIQIHHLRNKKMPATRNTHGDGGASSPTPRALTVAEQRVADREAREAKEQEYKRLKDKETFDDLCKGWCERISAQAGKRYFPLRQFFATPQSQQMGSSWQKLICRWLKIPDTDVEEFWNRNDSKYGGKKCAHKTISIRRMNVTNAIKTKFEGK